MPSVLFSEKIFLGAFMLFMSILFGCSSEISTAPSTPESTTPPPQLTQSNPPIAAAMNKLSAAEDLTSSWTESLAISVPSKTTLSECPDKDGDGFFDARTCGDSSTYSSAQLDCDDTDSNIGPNQEIYIPAGPFLMGSQSDHAGSDETPVHAVVLDGFCLDKAEVSTASFASFLRSEKRAPQGADVRHISTEAVVEQGREEFPAEGVTWQEASDYCASKGQTLPTEAQWEKSARGGCEFGQDSAKCDPADLRPYPWGNKAPSCELANHQLSTANRPTLCASDTLLADALPNGDGPYGHQHLAGNVWEYVSDVWHPSVYSANRINPAGPTEGSIHVLRGGGWNTFSTNMRVANRFHDLVMGSAAGFRCARSFTPSQFDSVAPLVLQDVSGTVQGAPTIVGRALYVTAFDSADADSSGRLAPGRSPIADVRFTPNQSTEQNFSIALPEGRSYILSAALDAGTGAQKDDYVSASGSGGFGHAINNPIRVDGPVSGIVIQLQAPPKHPPQHKGPVRPPGKPPRQ